MTTCLSKYLLWHRISRLQSAIYEAEAAKRTGLGVGVNRAAVTVSVMQHWFTHCSGCPYLLQIDTWNIECTLHTVEEALIQTHILFHPGFNLLNGGCNISHGWRIHVHLIMSTLSALVILYTETSVYPHANLLSSTCCVQRPLITICSAMQKPLKKIRDNKPFYQGYIIDSNYCTTTG